MEISTQRAVDVKEAFITALSGGGVSDGAPSKEIRQKLGIDEETKTAVADAGEALKRRYTPLIREQVREILRECHGLVQGPNAADSEKVRETMRAALAGYVAKKRSLRSAVLSGSTDLDKLRQDLA